MRILHSASGAKTETRTSDITVREQDKTVKQGINPLEPRIDGLIDLIHSFILQKMECDRLPREFGLNSDQICFTVI